ncbi:iron-sulfur cluster assembly protein [Branchiibius cervicis]|uniref:Iron-sulfur cluster assembly protein n=1 Tax=Branchiibius cervicis TaxID=908252 RepID=A0ABW2AQ78_9MICO
MLTLTRQEAVTAALAVVTDPELDEPITDLGFVRSVAIDGSSVTVHLRLPTSFCSPNFAYLMASDAKDALVALDWTDTVVVELDDHHDSPIINAGLAGDLGYRGTFRHEALDSLDELRTTFRRKAHTAAMERALTDLLRADPSRSVESLAGVRLADLPEGEHRAALMRRRTAIGLPTAPEAFVLVDHDGGRPDNVPLAVARARSTRISIDGNAHFCRGLLRTRYPGAEHDQTVRHDGLEPADAAFISLSTLKESLS